jgi:hypothetical protein
MKRLLQTVGVILACLVLLLVLLSVTGFGPHDRMPGLWLKGNVVTSTVTDWSFTETIPVVQLQTQTWYLLPHSVNINCLDYDGQLYLVSVYPAGTTHSWNENVIRDPHVRLKIGDQIYDRTAALVTDQAEQEGVMQARHKKYPQLKVPANATIRVFHVAG